MPEYRTLTVLVPRIAAGTLLVLLAGAFTTGNGATANLNKLIFVCILVVGVTITFFFVRRHEVTTLDPALALLASIGLLWGIWTIERPQLLVGGYWEGFGYRVAIGVVVLVLVLGIVVRPQPVPKLLRIVLWVLVGICCLCDILGAIRTIDYMPYVNNNLNEINDLLGPVAGKVPDSTFIPQYSALYGWLFIPLKHVLSPAQLVGAMSIFLTLLDIAAVVIAVLIARRALGSRGFLLPVALIVPITYVTSHASSDVSSIASLFQALPIRLFSGFVVIAVGLTDLVLLYRGTVRPKHLAAIGAIGGVIAWNSQDFGLAAALVYGVMITFGAPRSIRTRALGLWFVGFVIGIASYPLFLLAIGSPLNLSFVDAFVKLFGSGLGTVPMQAPGPVLVVVPLIIAATASGWALMRIRRLDGAREDALLDRATLTLAFVGTWTTVCLAYYFNRAYATGQLQTMLLPCGVCIASLLSVAMRTDALSRLRPPKIDGTLLSRWSVRVTMIPLGIFVCLCFSSTLLTPNPIVAARTLLNPPASTGYTTYDLPQVIAAVDTAQRYTAQRPGELTYLGESFNYVTLVTHVASNAVLFPFPFSRIRSVAQTNVTLIACQYLATARAQWLVLSLNALTAFGNRACGVYHSIPVRGVADGQLQEHN
jgi:hypothetical protein